MEKKWTPLNAFGLLLAIIGFICIIISFFQEGNKTFLNIGLLCTAVNLVLINLNKKNKQALRD